MGRVVAAVRVRHEALGAVGLPFDRAAQLAGGPGDDRLLGVMIDLGAEAAADIGGDDAQPRFGDVQHEGAHQQPDHVRVLAGREERVLAGGAVELADRGARLHRVGDEAVVDEVEPHHPRRPADRRVDRREIAQMPVVAEVARRLVAHLRRAGLQRRGRVDDRGLLGIVDADQLGRVARLRQGVGDDDRDRVADMAHPVGRQHRMRRLDHRRAVLRMDEPAAGQPADAVGREVGGGVDGRDPGCRPRRRGVDAGDPGIRVRAAQDEGVELAGPVDVVGVGALPGQEAVILAPPDRRSDRGHRPYSAAAPWTLAGGASPRITAAPSAIASTMLW